MVKRLALLASSLALGACSLVGVRSGTEEPAYQVLARLDHGAEVRRYGSRLAAETTVQGGDDWEARSDAFRVLARFIFGANRAQAEIAMTAPVEVEATVHIAMTAPVETVPTEGGLIMRFFMPANFTRATLPEPTDPRVRIVEVPPVSLAVLRFTGIVGSETVAERQRDLAAAVDGSAWRSTGKPVTLYYDPPWTIPFLRRNEVAAPVEPRMSA